jgi:hypothetical protein
MQQLTEQLTASKIFEEHADEIGRENIRIEQPVTVNGRSVYNVYINDPKGEGRIHVVVDARTDLPLNMSVDGPNGEEMRMSFQFDGDFDSSMLRPVLPSGVKFQHLDPKTMGGDAKGFLRGLEDLGDEIERMHDDGDRAEIAPAVLHG